MRLGILTRTQMERCDVAVDLSKTMPWLKDVSPDELRRIVDALYRVHRLIAAITDLDALLEQIMGESKQVANAEACSLMLYDPVAEELYFQVALGERGDQQALKKEIRLKLNQGIAGAAAARRESINVRDAQRDERFYRTADALSRFETHSLLAVPLLDRDKLIGVIEVLNKVGGGGFTETDLRIMEIFSALVATVIANARLIEDNLRAERMAAIGQAVARLSHHTKNIITGMTASVDLIDQGLAKNNLDLLSRTWPIFRRNTRRIANFAEDMLAFSRPREPLWSQFPLSDLLDEVMQTVEALLTRKNAAVQVDIREVKGPVCADQRGLFRCLLNLVMNAAEAVPKTDGRIWITARTLEDGALEIKVADNGPGVPEENTRKIFDPFFSTKGSQGTGLGLAVAHKIVAEHGGKIEVARSAAGGALFRLTVPPAEPSI